MKTKIYIAKATNAKTAPRDEVVKIILSEYRKAPLKLRKRIKQVSILKSITTAGKYRSGQWSERNQKLTITDHDACPITTYQKDVVHELAHAKFHWLARYHIVELKEFCKVVQQKRPPTGYVIRHERFWKQEWYAKHPKECNTYCNEYHSAIAEYVAGFKNDPTGLHTWRLTQNETDRVVEAYRRLPQ